ncbi:cytochrome P450 [Microdochium trichocladiopsis]|uniref:Cytochrome P450 n=1 Tax=Microdochium trichocladiopsis TaxID=1682393 RepID=A0A9P9BP35_9PEZI|nr:cytochrome P450 [Microdochium trichocladiopsis]KAH7028869.1 cytochrome P450 [Microdochium trichocladiopsis]
MDIKPQDFLSAPLTTIQSVPVLAGCLAIVAGSALYCGYSWALPKPIPGIPYDKAASQSLLGSLPEISAYIKKHGRLRPWLVGHSKRHGSVLTQFWMGPLAKPTLILADFQESRDILLRRGKEFDRSSRSISIFSGPIGHHHIAMRSDDPRFKGNKDLVRDLMTPAFLHQVTAPQIYDKAQQLIDLWTLKADLAQSRPFDVKQDIVDLALDIINAAAFGLGDDMCITKRQLDFLNSLSQFEPGIGPAGSATIPREAHIPDIAAIYEFGHHVGTQFKAISPKLAHPYKVLTSPTLSKAIARKNELIRREVEKTLDRIRTGDAGTRSAMDNIIMREMASAEKAGREPDYHSPQIYDELFGFIVAGHDTSASSIAWMIKWLGVNQPAQKKLRQVLSEAFPDHHRDHRQPSAAELIKTPLPYLEAYIQECLRLDAPVPLTQREATVDTEILGYKIPKGTEIFMLASGPGFQLPEIPVGDDLRREASRGPNHHPYGQWDHDNMDDFHPERWLKADDESGKEYFDPYAGPMMSFGFGPRGCFGRRLALLETRIVVALLVWNFEFHPVDGVLASREIADAITTSPVYCYARVSKIFE